MLAEVKGKEAQERKRSGVRVGAGYFEGPQVVKDFSESRGCGFWGVGRPFEEKLELKLWK